MRYILALILAATLHAHAATIVLQGTSSSTCAYQAIAVDPAGNVTVTCASGPLPPAGESCEQFITHMYASHGAVADPGGYAYWVDQCRTGAKTREQIKAAFDGAYPPPAPPVQPPGGGSDISDQAMHPFIANEGQILRFSWRQSVQSAEQLTVIQVAAAAQTGHWSIDGGPWQSFTPGGSDFRFIPIENTQVAAGNHSIDVKITGIAGGSGRFGIQNVGAGVGP